MTQMGKSARTWTAATGVIDAAWLRRVGGELVAPIYYLAGPPAMVTVLHETLNVAGVGDDDIRSEEFFGY